MKDDPVRAWREAERALIRPISAANAGGLVTCVLACADNPALWKWLQGPTLTFAVGFLSAFTAEICSLWLHLADARAYAQSREASEVQLAALSLLQRLAAGIGALCLLAAIGAGVAASQGPFPGSAKAQPPEPPPPPSAPMPGSAPPPRPPSR